MRSDYIKVCKICNQEYEYCPHCGRFDNQPRWRMMFDEENCMNIFYALSDYNTGLKTKEETIAILKECDLSKKDTFHEHIQRQLDKILNEKIEEQDNTELLKEEVDKKEEEKVPTQQENKAFEQPYKKNNSNVNNKYNTIVSTANKRK